MRERITSRNRLSLSPKWLYTVSLDTPASAAIASMLVPANALRMNRAFAAARIAARFSMSFGRPGPWDLTCALFMPPPSHLHKEIANLYYTQRFNYFQNGACAVSVRRPRAGHHDERQGAAVTAGASWPRRQPSGLPASRSIVVEARAS